MGGIKRKFTVFNRVVQVSLIEKVMSEPSNDGSEGIVPTEEEGLSKQNGGTQGRILLEESGIFGEM